MLPVRPSAVQVLPRSICCSSASQPGAEGSGSGCRAASRILTQLAVLLHGCETGTLRLGMVRRHVTQLRAVQTSITAALTSLSGLIHKSVSGAALLPVCWDWLT